MNKGVKIGYKETWNYTNAKWYEKKTGPGKWKFNLRSVKKTPSKSYGSHPKGRKIVWGIKGKQYVIKTGKGRYSTNLIGTKKLLKVGKHKLTQKH